MNIHFKKYIKIIIFLLSFIIYNQSTFAENSYTLKEVIELALLNNNNYKVAIEEINENRLKVRETWGLLWPAFSSDAVYTRQGSESGLYAGIDGQYNITFIKAELAVNPGAFYNSLQSTRKAHITSVYKKRNIKSQTITNTIKLFYSLMLAEESVKMRKDSLRALAENFRNISKGYNKGVFSRLDYLRAKVSYSNEKTIFINSENDYLSTLATLNIQIGKEIESPMKINLQKDIVNNEDLAILKKTKKKERQLLNELIKLSLSNRPEFIQLKKTRESIKYSQRANESVYLWPTFFVNGKFGMDRSIIKETTSSTGNPQADAMITALQEGFAPSGWNKAWSVSFGATYRWGAWSPLDSSHARSKQLKSKVRQMDLQMMDLIKNIKLEIKRGILNLKAALNSLNSQKGNIATAQKAFYASLVQFRNGIIDNTKLLEANLQLTTARTLYIKALYDYQVTKAELNRAIGIEKFRIY